jgi:hypothetical protein
MPTCLHRPEGRALGEIDAGGPGFETRPIGELFERKSAGGTVCYRSSSAIRLDVSQRLPPIFCTSE